MAKLIDDTTVCARCGAERWPTTLYAANDDPVCGECYRDERDMVVELFRIEEENEAVMMASVLMGQEA